MTRSKADWLEIFSTQTDGSYTSIARRVIGDLWGYDTAARYNQWKEQDIVSLANAFDAYREFIITT